MASSKSKRYTPASWTDKVIPVILVLLLLALLAVLIIVGLSIAGGI